MEDHALDVAAADGGRHRQCGDGERGVVVLRQGEPGDPPRGQVLDVSEVELALVGGHLSQVTTPLHVDRRRREVPFDQVRGRRRCLVGAGQATEPAPRRPAHEPLTGLDASTVFFDTRHPHSRRSARTRGEP